MRFALVGQPNCGKSTLFNQVAGYKAETGNFAGTTVTYTESKVRVQGEVVDVVDLPGTYALEGASPAESETGRYLSSRDVNVIVNVIDASRLAQGLTLTLELLQLRQPLVVGLNMMDEAMRLGMRIDGPELQRLLGVPVLPLIASRGRGVKPLFITALAQARSGQAPSHSLAGAAQPAKPSETDMALRLQAAADVARAVVRQGERRVSWRDRLDDVLLHPVVGYLAFVGIMLVFFQVIYGLGSLIEKPVLAAFDALVQTVSAGLGAGTLGADIAGGLLQGISGGVAIVLPYLIPFLIGLGVLEDIGYLPRVAFLMDALMHRLGLHGKAIVPFILGYGCNVPAIMSTRILEERRDRFLAAALATLVPCAARLAVVFGLVAFYLGPALALVVYVFNLFVIAVVGRILSRFLPEDSPGLILEMPVYRVPTLRAVMQKAWFRVREFVIEAWPILIAGSIVLALLGYFGVTPIINALVSPITWVLGLPVQVGTPLLFGILRKELSLVMLAQALGGSNFNETLTSLQMMTFTVFVVFYIPCLSTLAVLRRELGGRYTAYIVALTIVVALAAALVVRVVGTLSLLLTP